MKTKLTALLVASWFCVLGAEAQATNVHYLDIIQNGTLYRVNPDTGSYDRLGRHLTWDATTSITSLPFVAAAPLAYIFDDLNLWSVSLSTGAHTQIPLSGNGYFYGASPQVAVGFYNNALTLFLAQGHLLSRVDPTTGVATQIPGVYWSDPNGMVSFNGYIYLLEGNQLWRVNPSNGKYYEEWDFPTPATAGFMAVGSNCLYVVIDKVLWRYTDSEGATPIGGASWSGATSLAVDQDAAADVAFITRSNGYLYRVDTADGSSVKLGDPVWTGDTFATFSTQIVIQ
jgi:hypothetical protein